MNINYQKFDASLATAVTQARDREAPQLVVFVQTESPLSDVAIAYLAEMNIQNIARDRKIHTATLSPNQVVELSKQSWVRYIRLSQKLQLS